MRRGLATALACLGLAAPAQADVAADVDPMIGTFAPGFVVPGAATPFGMVQNSPDTPGPFAYSGYLWSDPTIRDFSLIHLSGPGVPKGGDIGFMPTLGPASNDPNRYQAPYTHAAEHAEAGYYSVTIPAATVELTAAKRAAMQRYTFLPSPAARVIMNTARSQEGVADAGWRVSGPAEVSGWRRGRYPVYFVARFSRPFADSGSFDGKGGWVSFDTTSDRVVTVRAGVSFVDEAGARRNLDAEAPSFGFDGMRARARAAWNKALGKVEVAGGLPTDRRAFYTALYHALLHPNVFSDADGRYRGFDHEIHAGDGRTQYANFSSWDTYKGENQLQALLFPRRYRAMLHSLLADAREGGRLPRWGEWDFDAGHMSGDPAIQMIADGICRGIVHGESAQALYEQAVALRGHRSTRPSAGTTLEFGVADFALALIAQRLGHDADAAAWADASLAYRRLLNPDSGWIEPRNADGSWPSNFDPTAQDGFQEGNSWQYSWLAPHDYAGLFARMGGDATVAQRLNEFFAGPAIVQTYGTAEGTTYRLPQYAPGNEHDIQAPYAPAWLGKPSQVADVMTNVHSVFNATVNGLPGNDDLGGLSGWAVFSALGFGPPTPGAPLHVIGTPWFEHVTLHLRGGDFAVEAPGASALSRYVQAAKLDGNPLERSWFADRAVRDGGSLELTMGPRPGRWATGSRPPSLSDPAELAGFGCAAAGARSAARSAPSRAAAGPARRG